jgi:hypothetical protein
MILRKVPNHTVSLVTKDVPDKEPSNAYTYMNFNRYEIQVERSDIDVEVKDKVYTGKWPVQELRRNKKEIVS